MYNKYTEEELNRREAAKKAIATVKVNYTTEVHHIESIIVDELKQEDIIGS